MLDNLRSVPAATSSDDFTISMLVNESHNLAEKRDNMALCLIHRAESQEKADEVVRQTFQKAYKQLEKFREESIILAEMIHKILSESVRKLPR